MTWSLPLIIFAAAVVSDFWRVLGALVSARIDEQSAAFRLVRCVATALIAAIIARLVLYPTGAMSRVPLWLRIGPMAAGFAAYLVVNRSMVAGTLVCEALLAAGVAWTG
jgi:Branched-chain amino acid transport protein (AzlD)